MSKNEFNKWRKKVISESCFISGSLMKDIYTLPCGIKICHIQERMGKNKFHSVIVNILFHEKARDWLWNKCHATFHRQSMMSKYGYPTFNCTPALKMAYDFGEEISNVMRAAKIQSLEEKFGKPDEQNKPSTHNVR